MPSVRSSGLPDILAKISQSLATQKKQGYIVGGFIRDRLLKRQTNDIDIAVNGNAANIARRVAKETGGKFVLLDDVNIVARVIVVENARPAKTARDREPRSREWHIDFSSFARDIKSDLTRRDFTINAMAVELSQFVAASTAASKNRRKPAKARAEKRPALKLIDPFSGRHDLRDKIVRRVSENVFEVDAARLLRAVRLAAELDLTIEPETESLIHRDCQTLTEVSGERIREEVLRLLALP